MIDNIYKGNYKLLLIPPVLFILISLLLIPGIKLGIDFTSGTLVSLALKQKVDPISLQLNLEKEGLKGSVKSYETALGQNVEVEFEQDKVLTEADSLKSSFSKLFDEAASLEVKSAQDNSYLSQYIAKKKELQDVANKIFVIAQYEKSADQADTLNSLQKDFTFAYKKTYESYQQKLVQVINKYTQYNSISIKTVSPTLGVKFLEQAFWVVIGAGIASLILVFIFFRSFIPSTAVLSGAVADIIIALGAMSIFQIPFTLPSFAALLMLIGFSLDTDILLTTRMLKGKGTYRENAWEALKTGMTMSAAAIVAFGTLFIISQITHISTYYEISAVALAGLFGDLFATWGINAVILIWHLEGKKNATK